ncbi:MAG: sigma 54-interacting transcriptional regulator [Planctomycetaceae bacterium]|jgi:two-component system response regulator HydG|nr:sigma 54-interacting transcriptional regulator [Planctomycetaceae bacterium]
MDSFFTQTDDQSVGTQIPQMQRHLSHHASSELLKHQSGGFQQVNTFQAESNSILEDFNTVLLVCEENSVKTVLKQFLEKENFKVVEATFDVFQNFAGNETFAAVLIDLGMNSISPEMLIMLLNRYLPEVPCILMDEAGRIQEHKNFCSNQVFSYMTKPCSRSDLLHNLRMAIQNSLLRHENKLLRQSIGFPAEMFGFFGLSAQYEMICKKILTYTRLDGPILLMGENGVGKGMFLQHIHLGGPRAKHPLIIVPCDFHPINGLESLLFGHVRNTIPEQPQERMGVLEIANQGTVYLNKINELPMQLQERICQFLKDSLVRKTGSTVSKLVNTRIVASTTIDLASACLHGHFHEDLYYRLNSMIIHIPPLRENMEDITAYAKSFIAKYAQNNRTSLPVLSHAALCKLQKYSWPGNMRELRNVIYRACVKTKDSIITEEDIVFDTVTHDPKNHENFLGLAGMTMAEIERRAIIETIQSCNGNRAESARILGVSEKTIYNKFKQFKLKGTL